MHTISQIIQDEKLWARDISNEGAYYSILHSVKDREMEALKILFPKGEADELNFVLFSTSGVHGTYETIENAAKDFLDPKTSEEDKQYCRVTFLVIQPRIVCMRYGNVPITSREDIQYLKKLRKTSLQVVSKIGI